MGDFRDNFRKVVPYVPGEQPKKKVIKLNTNENPYPPSNKVNEIIKSFDNNKNKLYPDPDCTILRDSIAKRYGFDEKNVFVGVGSDDVLSVAFLSFFNSDKEVLFPDITYSFYSVWADLYNIKYRQVKVNDDFTINKEDYYSDNGGIVIANPNAPTAICEPLEFIEDILKNNTDSVVIVDEAYIDFGGVSAVELIRKYDNLLVVQTFSKSRSLAGMRIGFAIGNEELIKEMNDESGHYYYGSVLELDGCQSTAETVDELMKSLDEAMEGYLEVKLEHNYPIPLPQQDDSYSGRFVLRLPKTLHKRLSIEASNEGVSLNQWACYKLSQHA